MLSRSAYRGEAHYGQRSYRQTEVGVRFSEKDEEEWIGVPFPALIDADTWDGAQEIKKERLRYSKRNTREAHLLSGLLVCGECGLRFAVRQSRSNTAIRKGKRYTYPHRKPIRYYVCGGSKHGLRCREKTYLRA